MRLSLSGLAAFSALVLAAHSALAQPDPTTGEPAPPPDPTAGEPSPPPPPPDPSTNAAPPPPPPAPGAPDAGAPAEKLVGPILPNMLPSRPGATIDVRADYSHFDLGGTTSSDLTLMGFILHGQYITPQGYGGYLSIPYYYVSTPDDSDNGAGNIELGGLYRLPQGPTSELLLRAAIALDTAGNAGAFTTPFSQLGPRFYDAYVTGLSATWLRAEGSYRLSQGNLRLGVSAGFDVPVNKDDGVDGSGFDLDALGKGALSAGFEQGNVGAAVGFVFMAAIGTDSDDTTAMGLNATLNFAINPATAIYGAFGWPDIEDNDEFDIWAVGAGVRAAIN